MPIGDEPKVDCHCHILDPARFPYTPANPYKLYPAQQLGKALDNYDMVRDGIADVTYINPGYQPGRFPIIAAGELPLLIKDATSDSEALDAWYRIMPRLR